METFEKFRVWCENFGKIEPPLFYRLLDWLNPDRNKTED